MEVVTIGDATLYCGDCLQILPTLGKVDAVITDPPYGIGEKMQGGTWGSADKYADFRKWDFAPSDECFKIMNEKANISIIWGGNYFNLPPSRCFLAWSKTNAVPTMADFELAWTNLDKPCKHFRHPVGSHPSGHPTEKPVVLMQWCIQQAGMPDIILDPFAGSGTTGVACMNLKRKFIGVEIDRRYFDIACQRIEAAQQQLHLF